MLFTHESQIHILKIKSWIRCKSQCVQKSRFWLDPEVNLPHERWTFAFNHTNRSREHAQWTGWCAHKNAFCTMATGLASRFKSPKENAFAYWTVAQFALNSDDFSCQTHSQKKFVVWFEPIWTLQFDKSSFFQRQLTNWTNLSTIASTAWADSWIPPIFMPNTVQKVCLSLNFEFISEFAFHTYCVCGTFRNHAI